MEYLKRSSVVEDLKGKSLLTRNGGHVGTPLPRHGKDHEPSVPEEEEDRSGLTSLVIASEVTPNRLLHECFSLRAQQNECSKTIQKDCQCVEITGKNRQRAGSVCVRRPICFLLHKLSFSPSPVSFLPLLPHAPREVSTEISVVCLFIMKQ